MIAELARAGGAVAGLGIVALLVGPGRWWRLGGVAAWTLGCGALAVWLAPAGHGRAYGAAAAAGLAAAVALAWLFVRVPWLLAVAVVGCVPVRIHVAVGQTGGRLLVPMYVVVAAAAITLAWQFARGDQRVRELGPFAWPLALVVGWSGVALAWSHDRRLGAVYLLFYVLPFALIAVGLSRLPWAPGWATTVYVQLAAMGLAFAAVGIWQYATRNTFWSPSTIPDDAAAPSGWFYRVHPVFGDPSTYARFLVVAILAGLVLVLFARSGAAWAALAALALTWIGLVASFSTASFLALGVGVLFAVAALWRRRAFVPVAVAVAATAAVALAVPQVHVRLVGDGGFSQALHARTQLFSNGIDAALAHPVLGVGTGGFRSAAHDTPTTIAAETGLPGLALLAWLLCTAFWVAFRRNAGRTVSGRARLGFGLALTAIVVESLAADTLFAEPLFWAALALAAVAARAAVPE